MRMALILAILVAVGLALVALCLGSSLVSRSQNAQTYSPTKALGVTTDLFLNENMESGTTIPDHWAANPWGRIGTSTMTLDNTVSHSGSRSLKIQGTGNAQDRWEWYQRAVPIVGKKYRIGVWMKTQSGYADQDKDNYPNSTQVLCVITPRDSGLNPLSGGCHINTLAMRTTDWHYVPIGDYVPRAGHAYVDISLQLDARNDANSIVWFDDVVSEEMDWNGVVRPTTLFHNDATFNLWSEHQQASVSKTDMVPSGSVPPAPQVNITAVKGERQAFQMVVQPLDAQWSKVNWTWKPFTGPHTFTGIIGVKRPLYITIPKAPANSYIRGGEVPDPMPVESHSTLKQNQCSPFMIEIDIPANTAPGVYTTSFYLKKGASTMATVPVQMTVKNVTIPSKPTFWQIGNMTPDRIFHYEDPNNNKDRVAILKRYLDDFKINRNNPGGAFIGLESYTDKLIGGLPFINTSAQAAALWAYMVSIGVNSWPPRGNWGDGPQALGYNVTKFTNSSQTVLTNAWKSIATKQIQAIMSARGAQGCAAFLWYMADEPNIFDPPTLSNLKLTADFIKSVDPRIKLCMAGKPCTDLVSRLDSICCADYQAPLWGDGLNALVAAGGYAGVYPNGFGPNQTAGIAAMRPETFRLLIWGLWEAGYRAVLWWSIGDWYEFGGVEHNPWNVDFLGPVMIYPPRNTNENGPIDSIRWSALREGMEDVELFEQLRLLIAAKTGHVPASYITTAQAALDAVGTTATHFPQGLNQYDDEFGVHDLSAIETVRNQVIDAIILLNSSTANPAGAL